MSLKQYAEREVRRRVKCATRLPGRAVSASTSAIDHAVVSVSRVDLNLRMVAEFITDRVEDTLDGICQLTEFANSWLPSWHDPWDRETLEDWS